MGNNCNCLKVKTKLSDNEVEVPPRDNKVSDTVEIKETYYNKEHKEHKEEDFIMSNQQQSMKQSIIFIQNNYNSSGKINMLKEGNLESLNEIIKEYKHLTSPTENKVSTTKNNNNTNSNSNYNSKSNNNYIIFSEGNSESPIELVAKKNKNTIEIPLQMNTDCINNINNTDNTKAVRTQSTNYNLKFNSSTVKEYNTTHSKFNSHVNFYNANALETMLKDPKKEPSKKSQDFTASNDNYINNKYLSPQKELITLSIKKNSNKNNFQHTKSIKNIAEKIEYEKQAKTCNHIVMTLFGQSGVGKSSLVYRITDKNIDPFHIPTIKVETFVKLFKYDSEYFTINIIDTIGLSEFQPNMDEVLKVTDFILYIIDLNDPKSFESIKSLIQTQKNIKPISKFLIGNKCDFGKNKEYKGKVAEYARQNTLEYFEISTKSNLNVNKLIRHCVNEFLNMRDNTNA